MKKVKSYFLVSFLIMLCWLRQGTDGAHAANAQPLEPFVFTTVWTAQAEFAGYYVAKEKGFYSDVGLDVKIQHPILTGSVYHRLETDECNASMFALMSAIDMISSGTPLVNIFQTSMNSSYLIISRWGKNPLEVRNQRLAVYLSEPNYMAFILNREKKLNFEWVFFTSNINLFLSGGVDLLSAVCYSEYILLKQAGFDMPEHSIFRFKDHGYNIQENGVYVRRDYYDTHRKQVKAFADASRRGWEWTASHPDQALDIVMKYVRMNKVQTNRVVQRLQLEEILKLQLDPNTGKREFRVRPDMVKKASRMLKENHRIDREVTYEELMGKTPSVKSGK